MKVSRLEERPPGFTYRKAKSSSGTSHRELHVDAMPVSRLAQRFGTPLYVYSGTTIQERFQQFDTAFCGCQHTVCYSVKANSNLSILRMLARWGAGFDIVSGGELHRVNAASRKAMAKVVFSGVGKQVGEIDEALAAGILLFNVESASELELLAARTLHLRKMARFAVRVNPDVEAKTHPYITTGLREHKFGVPWADASTLYRRANDGRYLKPAGISVHIGSQITEVNAFGEALRRVVSLVRSLRAESFDIRYVDAGGGLGIPYHNRESGNFAREVKSYAKALLAPLKGLDVHLLLEPGRAIVGPAGALISRVIYRKQNGSKRFVIVDAAMNDLIRPSLYGAYHAIVPVVAGPDSATLEQVDIVGPVCESGDFFARDRDIPALQEGELIALLDAGAYGMSLASNYNTRPRPAEVMVEGNRARLIRKRETIAELLAPERS